MSSTSNNQTEYQRRAARQRQLDLMEASASGVLPTMELDTTSEDSGFTSIRQRNQDNARRFLNDDDDAVEAGRGKRSIPSGTSGNTMAHAQLFGPRDTSGLHAVNLMDHQTGVYSQEDAEYGATTFVDAIFGVQTADIHNAAGEEGNFYVGDGSKPGGRNSNFMRASRLSSLCAPLRERTVRGRRRRYFVLGLLIFGVILSFMLATSGESETQKAQILHDENTERYDKIRETLIRTGISKENTFDDPKSTEHDALRWVAYSDPRRLAPDDPMLVQRYILAVFYYGSYNDFVKDHGAQPAIEQDGVQSEGVPVPGFHRRDYWLTEHGVCKWFGVTCVEKDGENHYDEDAEIIGFDMQSNTVYGHLPREFKGLTSLKSLNLSSNQLKGEFPPELGRMFWIKSLDLHGNSFSGELPKEIGFFEGMHYLNLSNNKFSGTVPLDIERMYNLRTLILHNNLLTGEFPSIGGLANLEILILSNNKFNTRMPQSFTNLQSLNELDLQNNEFTGPIPTGFKNINTLKLLFLQNNQFTGNLPIGMFESNKELKEVDIEFNKFEGALPTTIGGLKDLVIMKFNDNLLEGPIPEEWTELRSLEQVHFQNNRLKGPLPDSLGTMKKVKELWLQNNKITGNIPPALGNATTVESILLNSNSLTGEVPRTVSTLTNLHTLHLEGNDLTGSVPAEVCLLTENVLNHFSMDCDVECTCCTCSE
jgi:Leucine-rich repeat (LRR) protein